jgi:HPt (histidine-containing phosphotransfer) domain-containing protein
MRCPLPERSPYPGQLGTHLGQTLLELRGSRRVRRILESAVAADERARVRLLAHKVRAAGSTVYAHRLSAIAANIESEAMTAAMPALAAAVETLRRAFDEATLHIGARLP